MIPAEPKSMFLFIEESHDSLASVEADSERRRGTFLKIEEMKYDLQHTDHWKQIQTFVQNEAFKLVLVVHKTPHTKSNNGKI